ncbi:MAG: hypothetical protein ACOX4F_06465 [Atopobiaceae bacterium]|jgi:hypothetical protein
MAGLHCSDCVFSNIIKSEKNGEYYGSCGKGYTLTNRHPHECELPNFALEPESLHPSVDPYGKLYLGTSWVCPSFSKRDSFTGK